ncbi:MAG TPA: hypothetical protein VKH81_04980 [Candidatus Angelobacter sp.]|nr:hypothetical protein [Candidatus Angelobacter sp.]
MKVRRIAGLGILLVFLSCGLDAGSRRTSNSTSALHSAMPAGYDIVVLKPSGMNLSLMGLIECPELEGAQQVSEGVNAVLLSADGGRIRKFPRHFSFRITASLRKIMLDGPATAIKIGDDPRDLLLKLRFRVKAYHGLEVRDIVADSVEQIGMPADVPYDERVYRIKVDVRDAAITDRFVIEILTPEGELLTHFPFTVL